MNAFKRIALLMAGGLVCFGTQAVPARKGVVTVSQPDGTSIDVIICGDERSGCLMTPDSVMLMEDANGFLLPATDEYCRTIRKIRRSADRIAKVPLNGGEVPTTGTLRGLVILAEYPDVPFSERNGKDVFDRLLNEQGYSLGNANGSVRDYYIDQSYGLFTPEFDVAGPVVLPNDMSYYGGDRNGSIDPNAYRMIQDACTLVDDEVDFSKYDNNNDGKVDLVYVIYSGYAQSNGASTSTVWPHMWFLSEYGADVVLDGVAVDRYACSSERSGVAGDEITGIGLICHEFSHTLGLPDIYDTSYSSSAMTMGQWDVMDMGCYNNDMRTPAGYSSYEKSVMGWITAEELSGRKDAVSLPSLGKESKAFKMTSPNNPNEYYLLETRSKKDKWDTYLPGEGMLIVKVNYDPAIWDDNTVNTNGHHGVYLIPANGDFSSNSDGPSTPFPGALNVTVWTDMTTPSSMFNDGTYLCRAITGISYADGNTVFDIGQTLEPPVLTEPTEITQTGFRANWTRVDDAKYYTVSLTAASTGETVIYEKIVRNRFTFSNLNPDETYSYRVRTIGDVLVSDYSDERNICLSQEADVVRITSEKSIKGIFNLAGQYCGMDTSGLSCGIYIISYEDNTTSKVVIQ